MVRLNKHLARILGISRRQADDLIESGSVKVDGKTAELGQQPDKAASITVNGKEIAKASKAIYIALNKPVGYVCSRKQQGDSPTIYELLPPELQNLKTVGRLDRDSSGIILLTNDGDFAHSMTHPSFNKTKIYEVELDKPLTDNNLAQINQNGIELEDGISKFSVAQISLDGLDSAFPAERDDTSRKLESSESNESKKSKAYKVTMSEGRNRQIRRTFGALGYTVTKLQRIQFGDFSLQIAQLAPGKYKELML